MKSRESNWNVLMPHSWWTYIKFYVHIMDAYLHLCMTFKYILFQFFHPLQFYKIQIRKVSKLQLVTNTCKNNFISPDAPHPLHILGNNLLEIYSNFTNVHCTCTIRVFKVRRTEVVSMLMNPNSDLKSNHLSDLLHQHDELWWSV